MNADTVRLLVLHLLWGLHLCCALHLERQKDVCACRAASPGDSSAIRAGLEEDLEEDEEDFFRQDPNRLCDAAPQPLRMVSKVVVLVSDSR